TRRASSPPQLQPIQDRRFWKSSVRIPVTEVAAGRLTDRVKVGRSVPRKKRRNKDDKSKNKDDRSRKPQEAQTDAGSSGTNAGPSTSYAAASTSNAGPSSDTAPVGRSSSFAQSTAGSNDSWDDMDGCEKCVDYGCFGPRENRERFHPWKKKSRATMEAEKQAKEAKTAKKRKHHRRPRTTKSADPPSVVHPTHHLDHESDSVKVVSPTSPAAHEADRQRIVLHLQEQNEQLRRERDDAVAALEKAAAERDASEGTRGIEELPHGSHEADEPLQPQRPTGTEYCLRTPCNPAAANNDGSSSFELGSPGTKAGPSSTQEGPSGSKSTADPSAYEAGPSTSLHVSGEEPQSRSLQFNLDSLQVEPHVHKGKRREIDLGHPTNQAADSQSALYAPHHHNPQRDDFKADSSTYPAADDVDYHRVSMLLQEQVEQLRRQLDDSKRKAEAEMYLLENAIKELGSRRSESRRQQGPHLSTGYNQRCGLILGSPTAEAGSSSSQAHPSGSKSTAVESTLQAGPSAFSDVPSQEHPPSSAQSISDSIDEGGQEDGEG
ncbi:hypothetical protein PAXINDRAFT_22178, partial [Paxillus involutus ATCC 200175]